MAGTRARARQGRGEGRVWLVLGWRVLLGIRVQRGETQEYYININDFQTCGHAWHAGTHAGTTRTHARKKRTHALKRRGASRKPWFADAEPSEPNATNGHD